MEQMRKSKTKEVARLEVWLVALKMQGLELKRTGA
jgi:hypothetical protein